MADELIDELILDPSKEVRRSIVDQALKKGKEAGAWLLQTINPFDAPADDTNYALSRELKKWAKDKGIDENDTAGMLQSIQDNNKRVLLGDKNYTYYDPFSQSRANRYAQNAVEEIGGSLIGAGVGKLASKALSPLASKSGKVLSKSTNSKLRKVGKFLSKYGQEAQQSAANILRKEPFTGKEVQELIRDMSKEISPNDALDNLLSSNSGKAWSKLPKKLQKNAQKVLQGDEVWEKIENDLLLENSLPKLLKNENLTGETPEAVAKQIQNILLTEVDPKQFTPGKNLTDEITQSIEKIGWENLSKQEKRDFEKKLFKARELSTVDDPKKAAEAIRRNTGLPFYEEPVNRALDKAIQRAKNKQAAMSVGNAAALGAIIAPIAADTKTQGEIEKDLLARSLADERTLWERNSEFITSQDTAYRNLKKPVTEAFRARGFSPKEYQKQHYFNPSLLPKGEADRYLQEISDRYNLPYDPNWDSYSKGLAIGNYRQLQRYAERLKVQNDSRKIIKLVYAVDKNASKELPSNIDLEKARQLFSEDLARRGFENVELTDAQVAQIYNSIYERRKN